MIKNSTQNESFYKKTQNPYTLALTLSILIHIVLFLFIAFSPQKTIPPVQVIEMINIDELTDVQKEDPLPPVTTPQSPPKTQTPTHSPPKVAVADPNSISKEVSKVIAPQSPSTPEIKNPPSEVTPSTNSNNTPITTPSNAPSPVVSTNDLDSKNYEPLGNSGNKKPVYPEIARSAGIEGWVEVKVRVDEKGKVIDVVILKVIGHPDFASSVKAVAQNWRFSPPRVMGQKVQVWVIRKVAFRLSDS